MRPAHFRHQFVAFRMILHPCQTTCFLATMPVHLSCRWGSIKRHCMKALFSALTLGLLILRPALAATPPKLIVAILVDQLRYDYLERFQDHFSTNGFRLFLDRGVFMTSAHYDYIPTLTAPGHASFLSGSGPAQHGIIGNEWFDKKTRKTMYCVQDSSVKGVGAASGGAMSPRNFIGSNFADELRLRFQSKVVGMSMKDRGAVLPAGKKPVGAYWFESGTGNFITSTYYRSELPEWVSQFNSRKRPADFIGQTWDRLLDPKFYRFQDDAAGEEVLNGEKRPVFPHRVIQSKSGFGSILPTPFGNQILTEFARAAIEGEHLGEGDQTDLLTVSFSSPDYCGHAFGPYSHEIQDMVLRLDRQLEEFFQYLDARIGLSNITMVLTADHGVAPTPEFAATQGLEGGRVNVSNFVTNLVTKLKAKFGPGEYLLANKIFDGHLYFNHAFLEASNLPPARIASFIRDEASASGIFQAAYSRDQLLEGRAPGLFGKLAIEGYNPERSGDMVLIMKPYLLPGTGSTGTTHGLPYSYDTHVPVLFYGSGFKIGRYADPFNITDIVPTLAATLHMDVPAQSVGHPLIKIVADP